ncbi:uncharacterized protein [Anabrus simplex]|uniref:uncharacterized protein n=1 Tax=Anabrus simplex TaxID=316456 RepID=UPI0035A34943
MGPFTKEYILAMLYLMAAAFSGVTVISVSRVWTHWSPVLDTCIDIRCGCILYATRSAHLAVGGDNYLCHFASFSSVPVVILGLLLAGYHIFRACTIKAKITTLESMYRYQSRNGGDVVLLNSHHHQHIAVIGNPDWKLLALLSGLVSILLAANAAILTEGFFETCQEFRSALVKALSGGTPALAAVVRERLSCNAVFDLMDYMEQNIVKNGTQGKLEYFHKEILDTSFYLQIGIVASWFNLVIWVVTLTCNSLLAKSVAQFVSRIAN